MCNARYMVLVYTLYLQLQTKRVKISTVKCFSSLATSRIL